MSRRSKAGVLCLVLGIVFLIAALWLYQSNRSEALEAARSAAAVMEQLDAQLRTRQEEPQVVLPEPNAEMETVEIDGNRYIGFLTVPALELQLPVMADWDFGKLSIAPCRYAGTLQGNDLTVAAHNYLEHFGHLRELSLGEEVVFTDVRGVSTRFTVAELEILPPESVKEMVESDYDLTLFTCTYGGATRFTVRCLRAEAP